MKVPTTLLLLAPATTLGAVITITRTVIATVGPEIPEPTQAAPPNIIPSVPVYSGNRNSVPANGGKAGGGSDFTDAAAFQNDVLAAHNFYRKQHGAGDLVWNETSAQFGQKWSEACVFKHSGGPTGENLVAGPPNATASIDLWGQERSLFDFKSGGFSSGAGHFTQLVWKATTSVGCGRTTCNGKGGTPGTYTVCEYYPQGNIVGSNNKYFRDNVGAQIQGKPDDSAVAAAVGAVSG
ncbi:hypothetical protein HYFRA_00006893 [Hymenoscyphus fraxineus]|uniref:SCP domain-containing protein n=1 Tax=Hymenoscyphus fraxineus TaxID=746836 RepID=A0A9N9KQR2_9HELO|nr:hypothetical protein HYFRA_00006893 [Hymenoscyphus fraxineus]